MGGTGKSSSGFGLAPAPGESNESWGLATARNRIAPAPSAQKQDEMMAQQEPNRIGPDDAIDDQ